jgi:pentatricopeptide repeat protein
MVHDSFHVQFLIANPPTLEHDAIALAKLRAGSVAKVITYNAAISACEKCFQWERALSLLIGLQQSSLRSTIVSYNAAVSACEKAKQWQWALSLLAEIRAAHLELDIRT